ncbi:MAG TPA: PQQ-dependent sugar dehydrogenase, partial [Adhaeribacter sp.]|nr:PQQ-dependent sugar dehydrogenase [Adhaeribacter sp.]
MIDFSRFLLLTFLITASGACNNKASRQAESSQTNSANQAAASPQQPCTPLETRKANSPDQKPTFAGQTRACAMKTGQAFDVVVLAKGLEKPWAVEPLPNGDLLVTEKPGRLRIVSANGEVKPAIAGLPEVDYGGQGGLLDVALSPGFGSDRTIYWSFSEPRQGGNATSVARGVLSEDRSRLNQVQVIFRALPAYDGGAHFGSRLTFDKDGMLLVTLGDRSDKKIRPQAQHMDSHMGKILRIPTDGKPAPGNPFIGQAGALPEIW